MLDHLWQSTIFALVAAALAFALRRNSARVRYWLWFAASAKFFVPFALLTALGSRWTIHSAAPATVAALQPIVWEQLGRPLMTPPVQLSGISTGAILWTLWALGFLVTAFVFTRRWLEVRDILRRAEPVTEGPILDLVGAIPVALSRTPMEPGIIGIFRPTLVMPAGVELLPDRLRAIVAHELCHVARRDNLLALLQMSVQAVFWFHPLVWWLGARMIEDRERACDEAVLALGNEPETYAEGILEICRFCLESPVVCASGVTGGGLKRRIESILAARHIARVNWIQRAALALAGVLMIAAPVLYGMTRSPQILPDAPPGPPVVKGPAAKRWIAVTLKAGDAQGMMRMSLSPDRVTAQNITLEDLIQEAYQVRKFQIVGLPDWARQSRFSIDGVPDGALSPGTLHPLIQRLLADRFGLEARVERRPSEVLRLEPVTNGAQVRPLTTTVDVKSFIRIREHSLTGEAMPMPALANTLSRIMGKPIVDHTGMSGTYQIQLDWSIGNSISTALPAQLGLRLEAAREPIDIVVVNRITKPALN